MCSIASSLAGGGHALSPSACQRGLPNSRVLIYGESAFKSFGDCAGAQNRHDRSRLCSRWSSGLGGRIVRRPSSAGLIQKKYGRSQPSFFGQWEGLCHARANPDH